MRAVIILISTLSLVLPGCTSDDVPVTSSAKDLEALEHKLWSELQEDCNELKKEGWNFCDSKKDSDTSPANLQTGSEIYKEVIGRNPD